MHLPRISGAFVLAYFLGLKADVLSKFENIPLILGDYELNVTKPMHRI